MTLKREGLIQHRKAAGLSQGRLAEELGVERSTIHRWECGDTQPLPSMRSKIAVTLGVSLPELDEMLTARIPEPHEDSDVSGKALGAANQAHTAVGFPHGQPSTTPTSSAGELLIPSRLGADDVRYIEHANELFDRSDFLLGGNAGFRAALTQLEWGQRALERATMTSSVQQDLQKVLARLANRAGFMCFDAGNPDTARICFQAALGLSAEAHDWEFRTNILESMCHQSISLGRPVEAIGYCAMAEASPIPPPPNIHSLLNVMSAWGYAVMGDANATRQQLEKSANALTGYAPENVPAWSWWFDPSDTEGKIGRVLCELAKQQPRTATNLLKEACEYLERSVLQERPEIARTNTLNLAKLAEARMLYGDIDEAIHIARQVLLAAASVRSIRVTQDLHDLLDATQRHSGGEVSGLREEVRLTLASANQE